MCHLLHMPLRQAKTQGPCVESREGCVVDLVHGGREHSQVQPLEIWPFLDKFACAVQ